MRGVSFYKPRKKWVARIQVNNKRVQLGSFVTQIKAAKAYDAAAKKFFGDAAILNFGGKIRKITERQELAYKLCSPDFFNLSQCAAAKMMGISKTALQKLLNKVKKALPELFPMYFIKPRTIRYHPWMDGTVQEKF